jgi:glucose-1-phosphate cytidylyltransferase
LAYRPILWRQFFRRELFKYMKDGEELLHEPFQTLVEGAVLAYKYDGFWAAMGYLQGQAVLDDIYERGRRRGRFGIVQLNKDPRLG